MTGIDLDGVLDQVALDILERAQVAALVEDADRLLRQGGQVDDARVGGRDRGARRAIAGLGRRGGGQAGNRGKVVRLQIGGVGQNDGAIDGVLQLADVAGLVEGGQQGQGLGRGRGDAATFLDVEAGDEMVDQGRDVLAPLA